MTFSGFDSASIAALAVLPSLEPNDYAARRDRLNTGLLLPARALLQEVVAALDAPLTISPRGSISPLHTDLRFAAPGAPRYKDHLLLTCWHGSDKKTGPTLWIRIDARSVGLASGMPFSPAVRERWRAAVGGVEGESLAALLGALGRRHAGHEFEVAGDSTARVPRPWPGDHPRAELLRKTGFQVRFRLPLPEEVVSAAFAPWCATRLAELLPVHDWLVRHLEAVTRDRERNANE